MQTNEMPIPDPRVPLPLVLPQVIKSYLDSQRAENLYLILEHRLGLNGKTERSLEEVGSVLGGITRERVRQKQDNALDKLRVALLQVTLFDIGVDVDVLREIKVLHSILKKREGLVLEEDLIALINERYSVQVDQNQAAHLRLLLEVFGFDVIKLYNSRPIWKLSAQSISRKELESLSKRARAILDEEKVAVSYFDLLFQLASGRTRGLPDESIIRALLAAHEDIEELEDDYYQIKFESLGSAPKYAYRVLWESQANSDGSVKLMHSDEIAREINHRLSLAGEKALSRGTIVNGMTKESQDFVTVGKSGNWGLTEWGLESATIVDLMLECFHKLKRPANAAEMYKCVEKTRSDVSPNSITAYLSGRDEFVWVGRGIYQPRRWKLSQEQRLARKQNQQIERLSIEDYADLIIEIYGEKQVDEMPLTELFEALLQSTNRGEQTFRKVVHTLPIIELSLIGAGPRKKAKLFPERRTQIPHRTTMREQMQVEIRAKLMASPSRSAVLIELRNELTKRFDCPAQTFYRYVSEVPDVRKEILDDGTMIVSLIENMLSSGISEVSEDAPQYDVAISYAGQDQSYAQNLRDALEVEGLIVFFAPHRQGVMAGSFLPDMLQPIYRHQSRKCVIVHSKHYNNSKYTEFERKAAIDRKLDDEDYIILVKLDDSKMKGWLDSDWYCDGVQTPLLEVVSIIVEAVYKDTTK